MRSNATALLALLFVICLPTICSAQNNAGTTRESRTRSPGALSATSPRSAVTTSIAPQDESITSTSSSSSSSSSTTTSSSTTSTSVEPTSEPNASLPVTSTSSSISSETTSASTTTETSTGSTSTVTATAPESTSTSTSTITQTLPTSTTETTLSSTSTSIYTTKTITSDTESDTHTKPSRTITKTVPSRTKLVTTSTVLPGEPITVDMTTFVPPSNTLIEGSGATTPKPQLQTANSSPEMKQANGWWAVCLAALVAGAA